MDALASTRCPTSLGIDHLEGDWDTDFVPGVAPNGHADKATITAATTAPRIRRETTPVGRSGRARDSTGERSGITGTVRQERPVPRGRV